MKLRALSIILAIVVALVATGGVAAYVSQANNRALAGMRAVTTLVAQRQIAAATSASSAVTEGLLKSQRLPASAVPADAVSAITGGLGSLVLASTLQPGQLLLRPALVTASKAATSTGALAIPPGEQAVTVPMCLPAAVAGYVRPGSQVAVYDTYPLKTGAVQENCSSGSSSQSAINSIATQIVLPRAQVLSVGTAYGAASSRSPGVQGSVLVTFAVGQNDAERLIMLTEAGVPYLGLLTPSSVTGFSAVIPPLLQP